MIDDVLDDLASVGRVDSEGEFTLDRAKAREKMRRFQLADPRAYVLELVQAASLKGCTWVTFEIDSRDMIMELDGRPFTTADFDDIYGAVLTRRHDPDVLARRQLALGVCSAMALRPAFIEVESGDGQQGARLILRPDAEDVLEATQTSRAGTRIHVRERFTMGTFSAYFKNLAGTLAEEQLLRARCAHASFGIGLEGTRIDRGLVLHEGAVLDEIAIESEHARGVCGLRPSGDGVPVVRLVKDGVLVTEHELSTARFPARFVALVQDHALRKDVSQGDIVRDESYDRMLEVLDRGCGRALATLADRSFAGTAPAWAAVELVWQLYCLARGAGVFEPDEPTGLVARLRRLPLWKTTDGRALCLDEIFEEARVAGSVGFTRESWVGSLVPAGRSFVVLLPAASREEAKRGDGLEGPILEHALQGALRDVTRDVEAILRRRQLRNAWRSRPASPALPEGGYLCRRAFVGPGVRGELGIVSDQTDLPRIRLVVDGCLLVERSLALPWLGLRIAIAADSFGPNEDFDGIEPTPEACTAFLLAALELPALYAELARLPETTWRDACAMSMLEAMLRGDSLAALASAALEKGGSALERAVAAFGEDRLRLDPGLATDVPHLLVGMPLWRRLLPRRASLSDLLARARQGETLYVVAKAVPGVEADVLVLDEDELALLQPLFARPFVDARPELQRLARAREFFAKPEMVLGLDASPPAVVVPIEGEGIKGSLRVVPRAGKPAGPRTISVLYQRRPILALQLVLAGDCSGWVESSEVVPLKDYRRVADGVEVDRVRAAVLRAFGVACLRVAERARARLSEGDAAFLREAVALVFPTRAMRLAYDQLVGTKGVVRSTLVEAHRRMYAAMHLQPDQDKLHDRLMRVSWSKTAVADVLAIELPPRPYDWALAAVDVLFPREHAPEDPAARALRPTALLDELPLFSHHDGRPLALATIRELVERKQMLLHTDEPLSLDLAPHTMALVDATQLEVLYRLVGRLRVLGGAVQIAQARKRAELDARPKVDAVVLPPGVAITSMRVPARGGQVIEGEVGLAVEHPGDPNRRPVARVTAYLRRAELETVELSDQAAWLVAAVDDPQLSLGSDHRGVQRDEPFARMVARCRDCVPELVIALAQQWPRLAPAARRSAWYHVLDFLLANRAVGINAWEQPGTVSPAFAAAAAVPGFEGAGGRPLTALQLVQAHVRHGRLEVLPAPALRWGACPLPPERPVACVDPYEQLVLRSLLPRVGDVSDAWPRWQERELRRTAAPLPRTLAAAEVLVTQEVATPELQGMLAIPVASVPSTIELCAEGRVIATRSLPDVLPCWGSVSGSMIAADERWTEAIVDEAALQALRARSLKLYGKLGRWLAASEEHPERDRVVTMLAEVVMMLARAERSGPLPEPKARLLEDLRTARVLPLANGRHISLHAARKERPGELAHLDLWEAPGHRLQQRFAEAAAGASSERVVDGTSSGSAAGPEAPAASLATPREATYEAGQGASPAPARAPEAAQVASPPSPSGVEPEPAPIEPTPIASPPPSEPVPPPPTPEERLVDALRAELSLVREKSERLLSDVHLDRLQVLPLTGDERELVAVADTRGVLVNRDHPVVRRALADLADPVWCSFVASAVYTALNVWLTEITDADERTFIELLAALAASP